MTLAEAIAAFEKDFVTVTAASGYVVDRPNAAAGYDMTRAPDGTRYVVMTSGGELAGYCAMPVLFTDEDAAAEEWLRSAWEYAERQGGRALHWRARPFWQAHDFVAVDQAALMNDQDWRGSITLKLGTVISRLAVSKKGKE